MSDVLILVGDPPVVKRHFQVTPIIAEKIIQYIEKLLEAEKNG